MADVVAAAGALVAAASAAYVVFKADVTKRVKLVAGAGVAAFAAFAAAVASAVK